MIFDEDLIEKLIQRPAPIYELPAWESLEGEAVLVTGAGGFIGSHLCKELVKLKPSLIVLVEHNEFSLYEVHRKLDGVRTVPVLADYGNRDLMVDLIRSFNVQVVFHVGAYKHVPLVERNPLGAIRNNVLGAASLVNACEEAGVETFVVVSTDKAVRPTNIMGATKRMVEGLALSSTIPNVKVVRFGNVLWSTGSVLPLFYEQLTGRARVTLTHPDVDRYFMSVKQAVCLILQSIALVPRGTYVFDMGEPVKIKSLIQQLATEIGVEKYEIDVVGLRPGEKLHEELTLGECLVPTKHSQILYADEPRPVRAKILDGMHRLEVAVSNRDIGACRLLLQQLVRGYEPKCGIVDDLFLKKYVYDSEQELDDCFRIPVIAA